MDVAVVVDAEALRVSVGAGSGGMAAACVIISTRSVVADACGGGGSEDCNHDG
jgi:hypothetical protein